MFVKTASEILKEFERSGADRIAIWDGAAFCFPNKKLADFESCLSSQDISKIKYKFQSKLLDRYKDASAYERVFDEKSFKAYCRKIDFSDQSSFSSRLWETIDFLSEKGCSEVLLFSARCILYNFVTRQYGSYLQVRSERALDFVNMCPRASRRNRYFSYFCGYVESFCCACRLMGWVDAGRIKNSKISQLTLEDIEPNITGLDDSARLNICGQLASLLDRSAGAVFFNDPRMDKSLVADFYLDQGLCTYFSGMQLLENEAPPTDIRSSHRYRIEPEGGDISILVSFDIGFAATYLPILVNYARNLPDINFHFVLVGGQKEQDRFSLLIDALLYAQALCAGKDVLENVSVSCVSIPDWVKNHTTFFACARFLLARELLEKFDSLYIMDADVHFESDPTEFLKSLKGEGVAFPVNTNLGCVAPWRRYMAGNFYVERSREAMAMLSGVELYILRGLKESRSWMLDQNAISYSVEQSMVKFADLNSRNRPITQPKINKLFERNIFRG